VVEEKLGDRDEALIIHCHHGGRSARAVDFLRRNGYTNVKNLTGGIDAWSQEIDSGVPRY
jgi:rhodanese-related sulfurtransferase